MKIDNLPSAKRHVSVIQKSLVFSTNAVMPAETPSDDGGETFHTLCAICSESLDDGKTVRLGVKGAESVNKASTNRGSSIRVSVKQVVHVDCRKKHINTKPNRTVKRKSTCSSDIPEKPTLRSQELKFCFNEKMFPLLYESHNR